MCNFIFSSVVENVLQNEPIMKYNNIPIKMKRVMRQRDAKIFVLKFDTDKKIDAIRLDLYIEMLIGKVNRNKIDMTTDGSNEQTYLIQCEQAIGL